MRAADKFAFIDGLKVVLTLHDALFIEYPTSEQDAPERLEKCMQKGFQLFFPDKTIKMDRKVWGPEQEMKLLNESPEEYEFFRQYLCNSAEYF